MNARHYLILSIFILIYIAIISRLFFLQVIKGEEYREQITRNYIGNVEESPIRGSILFTTRNSLSVSGVFSIQGYTLFLRPSAVELSSSELYEKINEFINIEEEDIELALSSGNTLVRLENQVSIEDGDKLRELGIEGLGFEKKRWRSYPWGNSASHVLGFVGPSSSDGYSGRYGLEKYYNYRLSGSPDKNINSFANILLGLDKDIPEFPADLITTIEPTVQLKLQEEVEKIKEEWNGKTTGGIIIDPNNGRIYALASDPAYDPNNYFDEDNFSVFINSIVENTYEVGSIVKPLTIAIGIDSDKLKKDFEYTDYTGNRTFGRHTIYNFDKKGRGEDINIQSILSNSLNTGIAAIVEEIENETFKEYIQKIEIADATGIDLPNESSGNIKNLLNSPRKIESITAGYGQGIAVTPIAIVRALSSLANGGFLINPYIVDSINEDGKLESSSRKNLPRKRIFEEETTRYVSRLLTTVVDEALLGGTVKKERYGIAAKTGTALLVNPEGGYYEDRFLHSFFGYFPSNNPRFLIFLFTEDPSGTKYASGTLTEPFINLTDFLIDYYHIPPNR